MRDLCSFFLMFLFSVTAAVATSYVPMRDADLADGATVIVQGRVIEVARAGQGELAATDYTLVVERRIKGADLVSENRLVVRVPGGVRTDGFGLFVAGAPRFEPGRRVLLFLDPSSEGVFVLHQFLLGVFHVLEGPEVSTAPGKSAPQRLALRVLEGARSVVAPGAAEPADGIRDLRAFRRWLAARVRGGPRGAEGVGRYFVEVSAGARHKFVSFVSPRDPFPEGCGETGGHRIRWFGFETGERASWFLHRAGQRGVPEGGGSALRAALEAWTRDPQTSIEYRWAGTTGAVGGLTRADGRNAVLFDDPDEVIGGSFASTGILAKAGAWFPCDLVEHEGELFHPIVEADIVTQDGLERFFLSHSDPEAAARELFAHELGHTLGLEHSEAPDALMRTFLHNDGRGAALDADDLAGIHSFYGDGSLPPIPLPPTGLAATAAANLEVRLTWNAVGPETSNLRLERRAESEEDFRTIAVIDASRLAYTDTETAPRTLYTYRLQGQNASGRSERAAEVEVRTLEDRRPAAPSNLWAAPLGADRLRLTWQDNSEDESGFRIEIRQIDGAFLELPRTVAPDTRAIDLVGLPPATLYQLRVRAINAFGASQPTRLATASTFDRDARCVADVGRLCLLGGRLAIEASYPDGQSGEALAAAVPLTGHSGLFGFAGPESIDLLVQLLDPDGFHKDLRLRVAALSPHPYRLRILDTETGAVQVYRGPEDGGCVGSQELRILNASAPVPPKVEPSVKLNPGRLGFEPASADTIRVVIGDVQGIGQPCQPSAKALCLQGGRFRVEARWAGGQEMPSLVGEGLAAVGTDEVGFFWLTDPSRLAMAVKLEDGSQVNGSFWLTSATTPPAGVTLVVTDTHDDTRRVYQHSEDDRCAIEDREAFPAEAE